ncbi:MAG: RNA pseudouridine synthase [Endomicrobia bacterium]|nr:RNA pseudouridine synthase [Endomicrobiia bacterium]
MTIKNIKEIIIYEDEDYLIVNKNAGISTLPERYDILQPNLLQMLQKIYKKIFVLHRLDKETSGLIIFAKNELAHKHLSQQFLNREIQKLYIAVTYGVIPIDEGKIELPIGENQNDLKKVKIDFVKGKPSITEYKIIERFKDFTFIQAKPITGRRHQIRIHLSAIGYPLVADKLYSNKQKLFLSEIKQNYKFKKAEFEKPIIERTALHSYRIEFYHFRKKQNFVLYATPSQDLQLLIKYLRKYNFVM